MFYILNGMKYLISQLSGSPSGSPVRRILFLLAEKWELIDIQHDKYEGRYWITELMLEITAARFRLRGQTGGVTSLHLSRSVVLRPTLSPSLPPSPHLTSPHLTSHLWQTDWWWLHCEHWTHHSEAKKATHSPSQWSPLTTIKLTESVFCLVFGGVIIPV